MTTDLPGSIPDPAAPIGRPDRRRLRRATAPALAVAVAAASVVAVLAGGQRAATGGSICVDVASAVGLRFTGDYGPVFPTRDAYGTLMQENMGNGAAVGDIDGDGFLDVLLLGQAGQHSRLFHNDPAPDGGRRFSDITQAAGLGDVTSNARVAQFVDLTGTGRPDLVIAADYVAGGPAGPSQLFRNDGGGRFSDVTAGSGFEPTGYIVGGMTVGRVDETGRPSILVSYWTNEGASDPGRLDIKGLFPGHNRLYRNLGDYRFEDATAAMGQPYSGDSFSAVITDFTADGLPDIYQANDNRPDRFYENQGDGTFRDPGYRSGLTRVGNSMGVAPLVDASGGVRLFVTHITDPSGLYGSNIGNTLIASEVTPDGIRFRDAIADTGLIDTAWGWGDAFVDLDLDGALDAYAVQGMDAYVAGKSAHLADATAKLFLGDGTGTRFTTATGTGCDVAGDQRALVVFDYDRDGAPDLLITQVAGPTLLLENRTTGRHWLTVAPTGDGDAGIGARIAVTAAGRTTTQLLLAGGSYLAGPPREAYFGLGDATVADVVRIAWADGTVTERRAVPADQVLRVPHG